MLRADNLRRKNQVARSVTMCVGDLLFPTVRVGRKGEAEQNERAGRLEKHIISGQALKWRRLQKGPRRTLFFWTGLQVGNRRRFGQVALRTDGR